MLTPVLLRDMHKRIAEAHAIGLRQVSNWTEEKDEPQTKTQPLCYFKVPIGVPSIDERGNVFRGLMCDVHFVTRLLETRTQDARDAAYNAMSEVALRVFSKFLKSYVHKSGATHDGTPTGIALDLSVDEHIRFDPFVDDGPSNLTGCRMVYVVRDRTPLSCSDDAQVFPSLA